MCNELLHNGHKTAMELSHFRTANGALKNDFLTHINSIIAHINHIETQLQAL
jgi:hypothetical protein